MLSGKYECYGCGEVFETHRELVTHEEEGHCLSRSDLESLAR